MRKRIYIAGPISKGDLATNVDQATAAFVALAKAGYAPFCPHWSVYSKPTCSILLNQVGCIATIEGNPTMQHADWMGVDLAWVVVSDGVLRLPGESTGADMEVAEAKRLGLPVFNSFQSVIDYDRTVWRWNAAA